MIRRLIRRLGAVPDLYWLTAIILLGTALRLNQLGAQSLWLDEAFSWLVASQPLDEGLQWAVIDFVHPPLYYLLLHVAARLSQSEFVLRLPSTVAALVSIPLLYQLGRAMAGTRARASLVGLLAAALLAVNPFDIWFSKEARNYELAFLLAVCILYTFHYLLRGRRSWPVFVAASALAYLTHYFTLLLALVQFVYILLEFRKRHRLFRGWVLAQALAILPLALWMAAVLSQEVRSAGIGWIPRPALLAPLVTLWSFALLYVEPWPAWHAMALPFFIIALILGLLPRQRRTLLALWLCLPALSMLLFSWLAERYLYVDRFFVISLPAFLLLLARGAAQPRRDWARVGLAVALLVLSTAATWHSSADPHLAKQDWRGTMAVVTQNRQPGDLLVLHYATDLIPALYYQGALQPRIGPQPHPEVNSWADKVRASPLQPWTFVQPRAEASPWPAILAEFAPRRVWLVYPTTRTTSHSLGTGPPSDIYGVADPATVAWLNANRGNILQQDDLSGISVVLVETGR